MIRTEEDFNKARSLAEPLEGKLYTIEKIKLHFTHKNIVAVSYCRERNCPIVDVKVPFFGTNEIRLEGGLLKEFQNKFPEYLISIVDYDSIHETEMPF